jgi:hypothetical protein
MMVQHRWFRTALLTIGLAALVSGPVVASAQTDAPATYTGDLWTRPRLTGDWWESRDWLAKRGVTLDPRSAPGPPGRGDGRARYGRRRTMASSTTS